MKFTLIDYGFADGSFYIPLTISDFDPQDIPPDIYVICPAIHDYLKGFFCVANIDVTIHLTSMCLGGRTYITPEFRRNPGNHAINWIEEGGTTWVKLNTHTAYNIIHKSRDYNYWFL